MLVLVVVVEVVAGHPGLWRCNRGLLGHRRRAGRLAVAHGRLGPRGTAHGGPVPVRRQVATAATVVHLLRGHPVLVVLGRVRVATRVLVHGVLDGNTRGGQAVSSVGHLPVWNVVLPLRRAVHGGGAPRVLLLWGEVVVHGGRRRVGPVGGTVGWPGVVWGTSGAVTRGGLPVARGGAVVAVLPRAPALAVGRRLPRLLLLAGVGGRVVQVWWDVVGRCVVGWQVVPAAVLAPRDWVRLLLLPIVRCWAQFLCGALHVLVVEGWPLHVRG